MLRCRNRAVSDKSPSCAGVAQATALGDAQSGVAISVAIVAFVRVNAVDVLTLSPPPYCSSCR
eukprot:11009199-Alexandrium_andersonii.AAC.1